MFGADLAAMDQSGVEELARLKTLSAIVDWLIARSGSSVGSPALDGSQEVGEEAVLPDIGRDHLGDLPGFEQEPETGAVDPGIVRDDGQALHPGVAQRQDQLFRDAAQAKAAGHDHHPVMQEPGERRLGIGIDLVRHRPLLRNQAR